MEKLLKTEAIVLRAKNYNEADQILTLFTHKAGKIAAIVKGVKKPKSRLRGGVQVFSHTNLVLYLGANLATVTGAETINTFSLLREDLTRMSYAAYLAELIDSFTPPGEKDEEIFRLALMGLYLLSIEEPWLVARALETKILMQTGYQPQMESCVECGKDLTKIKGIYQFAPMLGGIICPYCNNKDGTRIEIGGEALGMIKRLQDIELTKVNRLRISLQGKQEIEELLEQQITHSLGKKIKSKDFLDNLA